MEVPGATAIPGACHCRAISQRDDTGTAVRFAAGSRAYLEGGKGADTSDRIGQAAINEEGGRGLVRGYGQGSRRD